jgi:tRNA pseudouridine38-40 synthase
MQKVKLLISYDGTDYEGWQRQADGKVTVQETLEVALSRIFNTRMTVTASGRTDGGVHAEAQVVHFKAPKDPTKMKLVRALNSVLPDSVSVKKAWLAPEDFHAQKSAVQKTYRYLIHNSPIPDPLRRRYTAWIKKPLNIDKLNEITEPLLGEHDFKSFQTSGTVLKTTVRTIKAAKWAVAGENLVEFRITGTGFLKQMVRNIVGTAIYLYQNDLDALEMTRILAAKDRQIAKNTARPEGLRLESVEYPADLDNKCSEI